MIDELREVNGTSITMVELHARMLNRAERAKVEGMPIYYVGPKENPSVLLHKLPIAVSKHGTQSPNNTRVLITVSISGSGTIPDASGWTDWLSTNMPPRFQDIEIDHEFHGHNPLVLLSIPIEIWSCLTEDPAYAFVGFNTSEAEA